MAPTKGSDPGDYITESCVENDLIRAFKIPLCVANIFGLPTIVRCNQESQNTHILMRMLTRLKMLLAVVMPLVLMANLIFNVTDVVSAMLNGEISTVAKFAGRIAGLWWWTSGLLIYLFLLFRCKQSSIFFLSWATLKKETSDIIWKDHTLARDVNVICFVVLISATVDTTLYEIYALRDKTGKINSLSAFLDEHFESNQYLSRFVHKNEIIAALHFLINKQMLFAINFGDILVMMISRAIYGQIRGLEAYLQSQLDKVETPPVIPQGKVLWGNVRHSCFKVLKALEDADQTYYVLIWISYATNVFFICNQLFMGIGSSNPTESLSLVHRLYVIWSFFHLILRTVLVNIIAAQINEWANKVHRLLLYCSSMEYNSDVRRLERYLGGKQVGLSGNGVFVITRHFMLTISSAIFTLEVVLLQNSA